MFLSMNLSRFPCVSNQLQGTSNSQQQNRDSAPSPAFKGMQWLTSSITPSTINSSWIRQTVSNFDTSWLAQMVDPTSISSIQQSIAQQLGNNYISYSSLPTDILDWRHGRQLQVAQGQSLAGLGNTSSAYIQQSQQNNPWSSQNPQTSMEAADKAYQHSRFRHAILLYDRVLIQDPRNAAAYNRRGLAKAAIRDNSGAIADYTLAIGVAPNFYNAYLNRGNLWMYAKDYQRALADYGKAIEINPTNRAAYENRSELYTSLGRHDLSLKDRETVIRLEEARMSQLRPKPATYPLRLALVLANDDYPGEINDLHGGPLHDANNMTKELRDSGFNVLTGFNLTGPQTEAKVAQLVSVLNQHPGSVSLIYYSGHGGAINGNNYLIPVEYTGDNAAEVLKNAVSVDYLLEQLKLAPSAFNMIFLDACRTRLENGLPGDKDTNTSLTFKSFLPPHPLREKGQDGENHPQPSFRSQNNVPSVGDWNVQDTPAQSLSVASKRWETEPGPGLTNTWVEYASRPNTIAVQQDGQGLYTKYLLKYMDQPGLNLEEVSMYTNYALEKDPEAIAQNQHARTQTDLSRTEPLAETFYFKQPMAYTPTLSKPQTTAQS
jgi:tetratricopeptide (TPR) repeat protein